MFLFYKYLTSIFYTLSRAIKDYKLIVMPSYCCHYEDVSTPLHLRRHAIYQYPITKDL